MENCLDSIVSHPFQLRNSTSVPGLSSLDGVIVLMALRALMKV